MKSRNPTRTNLTPTIAILITTVITIIITTTASASSGVSPSSYTINFEPNLEEEFEFTFNFDQGPPAETYVSGNLAEYVTLDKESVTRNEKIIAHLKLPQEISTPGEHKIRIGAKQIPSESGGIEVLGDVKGLIKIQVPYPGKYAEAQLSVSNANLGENIKTILKVHNKGSETIEIHPSIEIYNSNGVSENLQLESKSLTKTESTELVKSLNSDIIGWGKFNATATIIYNNKELKVSNNFRIGKHHIEILDYTKSFERDKINRMQIDVENYYNSPIENIYANVTILNPPQNFLTPPHNSRSFRDLPPRRIF